MSLGRVGESAVLDCDDDGLAAVAVDDLSDLLGVRVRPAATCVTRWRGRLPQYAPGHLTRVARIRAEAAMHPGLGVCGAAMDGLGIPACIASAGRAVEEVLDALGRMAG
jgi:oxygen-dependent protoporphyrinogen oxidase